MRSPAGTGDGEGRVNRNPATTGWQEPVTAAWRPRDQSVNSAVPARPGRLKRTAPPQSGRSRFRTRSSGGSTGPYPPSSGARGRSANPSGRRRLRGSCRVRVVAVGEGRGMRDDLPPTLFVHGALPSFREAERLSRVGAVFRQQGLTPGDDSQLPACRPLHQRASCPVVSPLHRPQRADIVSSVLTRRWAGAHVWVPSLLGKHPIMLRPLFGTRVNTAQHSCDMWRKTARRDT